MIERILVKRIFVNVSSYGSGMRFGPYLTSGVRLIVIITSIAFAVQFFSRALFGNFWESWFALSPTSFRSGFLWQAVTYGFLHGDFFHLLFNMLALWMFGSELEAYWDRGSFYTLYFFSIVMGALVTVVVDAIPGMHPFHSFLVLGASAGVYGILVAFAMIWPDRELLFMLIFPMKAKYFVMILMLLIVFSQGGNVAHMAHLGGAIGGYLYVKNRGFFRKFSEFHWSPSRYLQKRKMLQYQKQMYDQLHAKERVDELLAKISKSGMNSLSSKEKKFLKEASAKYYNP
jgi:membrane associated rhomboid family serine protease